MKVLGKTILHPLFVCNNIKSQGILGQDFIRHNGLSFCAANNSVHFVTPEKQNQAHLSRSLYLPARSATMAEVQLTNLGQQTLAIHVPGCTQIYRNEVLLEENSDKNHNIYLVNVSTMPQKLPRGTPVGVLENVHESDLTPWNENEAMSIEELSVSETSPTIPMAELANFKKSVPVLTEARKKKILQLANLNHLAPNLKDEYLKLIMLFHDVISTSEFDIGRTSAGRHSIPLIDENKAIFEKQFPLPIAHRLEIARQVKELLRLGLVSRVESEFNCSLFLTKKRTPEGSPPKYRIVQNLKGLNAATKPSSFRLNRIDECLDRIGLQKSTVFSNLDLRSGYYNVEISEKDRHKTAFWVENIGQLAWNVCAQGLVNSPATFSRIIHRVFREQIEKCEVENYLDDLLCHAKTHKDMLRILKDVFKKLRGSNLKINLEKCKLGADNLIYLGFNINKDGYSPSPANIRTVTNTKEPQNLRLVRAFIGVLNFYHGSLPNYSSLIKPLSQLTSNKSQWHGGPLPPAATRLKT